MRRRQFITLIGGAVAWPWPVTAQSIDRKEPPIVGFLDLGSERSVQSSIEAFRSGLAALGYVENQNIRVLYRFAEGRAERLSELTKELVSLGARVIVTISTTAIRAAHAAVPTVPIVSRGSGDPVAMGWAQSLARPGGMITGLFIQTTFAKSLELLKQMRPEAIVFASLANATNPGNPFFISRLKDAAGQLGITLHVVEVREPSEFAEAFRRMTSLGAQGLFVVPDPVFSSNFPGIVELALQHQLPTAGDSPGFTQAGGLFAYSFNYPALARRSAWYVDRILRGDAPGDLAMEEAREYKLIINLKTAKALGLTIPPTLLGRADEVIE
jgi:putative tryptophan/tyrosine transport system substrate-binding protein